ncbi:MAG TPA: efflux RND transporter permease subunit, partial [Gemmataceae bacterium]|nr:efflux RND transporter permease subunit [Gemmataceae bacterium]
MALPQRAFSVAVLVFLLPAGAQPLTARPIPSPQKPLPALTVEATYPGAGAQVVADTVAAPVEQQVNGVEGLRQLCSRSTDDGRYTLQVIFAPGVDLTLAQVLVQNRVNLALLMLPDVVKQRGVTFEKKCPGVLLFVLLYSPDGSRGELALSNYASLQIQDELARVRGVGDVTKFGGQDYGMRIWLEPDRLAARNLAAGDVVKALETQNAQVTGESGAPYTVHTLGRLADIDRIGDIVIKTGAGGHVVRLKDVARVELGGGAGHFARLDG